MKYQLQNSVLSWVDYIIQLIILRIKNNKKIIYFRFDSQKSLGMILYLQIQKTFPNNLYNFQNNEVTWINVKLKNFDIIVTLLFVIFKFIFLFNYCHPFIYFNKNQIGNYWFNFHGWKMQLLFMFLLFAKENNLDLFI